MKEQILVRHCRMCALLPAPRERASHTERVVGGTANSLYRPEAAPIGCQTNVLTFRRTGGLISTVLTLSTQHTGLEADNFIAFACFILETFYLLARGGHVLDFLASRFGKT